MPSQVKLQYSKENLGFFNLINQVHKTVEEYKKSKPVSTYNEDNTEIGRSDGYAVFPELLENFRQGHSVTLESFRKSLSDRGVVDIDFQNKILNLVLQNKSGLQFALGRIMNQILLNKNFLLIMNADYKLEIEVEDEDSINLIFKGVWEDPNTDPRTPAIEACVKVNMTPGIVAIDDFKLTKLSDSANDAFKYLEANQKNILMQLFIFIKNILGFNSELRLEEKQKEDPSWSLNPK
jgi:hypothetical protein